MITKSKFSSAQYQFFSERRQDPALRHTQGDIGIILWREGIYSICLCLEDEGVRLEGYKDFVLVFVNDKVVRIYAEDLIPLRLLM